MTDYYMGMELPPELPSGSRLPDVTPPEGVVFRKVGMDGWTRKYLRHSGLGGNGRPWERNLLVAEIPPDTMAIPSNAMGGMVRGRASAVMTSPIQLVQNGQKLGQVQSSGSAPVQDLPPAEDCPLLPVEMPDGRTLNPDDPLTLRDLCEIVPHLIESMKTGPKGQRTGPVPLTGQQGAPYATVISPPSGMFGAGGAPGGGRGGLQGKSVV